MLYPCVSLPVLSWPTPAHWGSIANNRQARASLPFQIVTACNPLIATVPRAGLEPTPYRLGDISDRPPFNGLRGAIRVAIRIAIPVPAPALAPLALAATLPLARGGRGATVSSFHGRHRSRSSPRNRARPRHPMLTTLTASATAETGPGPPIWSRPDAVTLRGALRPRSPEFRIGTRGPWPPSETNVHAWEWQIHPLTYGRGRLVWTDGLNVGRFY